MRRIPAALPWVLLAIAVGVGAWIGVDLVRSVRQANELEVAASTTTVPPSTTNAATTSTTTLPPTTSTTIPASALDGIVVFVADDCYRCDFLESRLGDLAGEVPVWVRPADEGMTRLPTVVVQYAGEVRGRWEGQVAVNNAETIAAFAGERWAEWQGVTTTEVAEMICGIENPEWVFSFGSDDRAQLGFLTLGNSVELNFEVAQVNGILTDLYLADYRTTSGQTIDMWYAEFCFRDDPRLTGVFILGTPDQRIGVVSVGAFLPFDPILEGQDPGWDINLVGLDEFATRVRIGRQYAFELFLSSRTGPMPDRIDDALRYNRALVAAMREGGEAPQGLGWLDSTFYALRGRL